ncbi:ComEA family DNA-binding protein [Candidatus Macondimonas diazotrophica]|jgi:competence protein ComEA|uniref:Helix-hairpin-helix domain-containing protein n=1 Tax=Candidatus Macondimonas diazotrophica TaxID=2305248 RepID=A0A4Z0FEI1_9GAMM|nr:helix-hairpin-helix domain-containing protein [Candidatus Macondimonas diazotrophica]TFZ83868.1 helix-hairpin-helix domain-containing protein [Candidatus Macondimonas diazotrophica]HBG31671.1 competence protein ComEA [Gammaproteobacteria bacterium]HBG51999.1 competence protein ComEA [Gammaproteobacteria bacterium]
MFKLLRSKWMVLIAGALMAQGIQAAPVNINTADAEAIADALPGIGPAKAKAIVDYRTKNGPFKVKEDLTHVPGIGDATLEKIAADVLLQEGKTKSASSSKR